MRIAAVTCTLLVVSLARAEGAAPSASECADAAEQAQLRRTAGDDEGARERLLVCTYAGCPAVIRTDCEAWAAELSVEPADFRTEPVPEPVSVPAVHRVERVAPFVPEPAGTPPWVVPALVTGTGILSVAAGATLDLSARSSLAELRDRCAPACTESDVDAVRTRMVVGDALLVVGAATAVVGGYLWVRSEQEVSRSRPRVGFLTDGRSGFVTVSGSIQ